MFMVEAKDCGSMMLASIYFSFKDYSSWRRQLDPLSHIMSQLFLFVWVGEWYIGAPTIKCTRVTMPEVWCSLQNTSLRSSTCIKNERKKLLKLYNEIYFQYVSKSKISVEFQRPYMQDIYFTDEQIKTTCNSSNINQWHPKNNNTQS